MLYIGCKFWHWEEEYNDILIEHNLVDVLALLASIEARDETSALVDRIEARHVYFFTLEEERSTQDRASADQQ